MNITDLILMSILGFITVIIAGFFIYAQSEVGGQLETQFEELTTKSESGTNYTEAYDEGFGTLGNAYSTLNWLTGFMLFGYALAIFFSAYMVNTRPIFFIVFLFSTAISILLAVVISNAYAEITATTQLASSFTGMYGANFILQYFPLWVAGIGVIGMIIMFARFKKSEAF